MNDVPLVKANNIHDINTSIIAIKKQLKQLNEAVGLIDMPTIDTSIFVKKSEVVDVVEEGNMNPVTSNAVVPIDEVTSGNMHSVTSNAVAEANIYDVEVEVDTGRTWAGHKVYRKMINKEFQSGVSYQWVVSSEVGSGNYQVINLGESMIHGDWGTRQPWYVGSMAQLFMDSGIVYFLCNHPDGIASLVCYYCKSS